MPRIRLTFDTWHYDDQALLGPPGGMGEVFEGTGPDGTEVAVKRLKLTAQDAAHREMQIAEELRRRDLLHVVPIYDFGLDEESSTYFVVMARGGLSLKAELEDAHSFSEPDSIAILLEIASGLSEVPDIVHRDLKPGNVIRHGGVWKITDFGIARFLEESTSSNTLKGWRSNAYAAPEQWLGNRASAATDVYALGCIGYALLTGEPPFHGPEASDYEAQHISSVPPQLTGISSPLASLLYITLNKAPEARPDVARVIRHLADLHRRPTEPSRSAAASILDDVGALEAARLLRIEAAKNEETRRLAARAALLGEASHSLDQLTNALCDSITLKVLTATCTKGRGTYLKVVIGDASLAVEELGEHPGGIEVPEHAFDPCGWDVVAGVVIGVAQSRPHEFRWTANLWYTDSGKKAGYRWIEICYMQAIGNPRNLYQPFALQSPLEAARASAPGIGVYTLAATPKPVDGEDTDDFCLRWCDLLATAYQGNLRTPPYLPLP